MTPGRDIGGNFSLFYPDIFFPYPNTLTHLFSYAYTFFFYILFEEEEGEEKSDIRGSCWGYLFLCLILCPYQFTFSLSLSCVVCTRFLYVICSCSCFVGLLSLNPNQQCLSDRQLH